MSPNPSTSITPVLQPSTEQPGQWAGETGRQIPSIIPQRILTEPGGAKELGYLGPPSLVFASLRGALFLRGPHPGLGDTSPSLTSKYTHRAPSSLIAYTSLTIWLHGPPETRLSSLHPNSVS